MKKTVLISVLLAFYVLAGAQVIFQTSVKAGPVVVGEPFTIQYLLEDIPDAEFIPPDFTNFRVVNKPRINEGETFGTGERKKLKNIIYTLEALKPGKFIIPAGKARVGNYLVESDDVRLEVIGKEESVRRVMQAQMRDANNAAYFLRPGEDPYQKIRKNLFLKVLVDKKTCFVGEPVTATFKLYSRLVSRSDIVKNPGFYGFTVQDILGLDAKKSDIETINGNKFDVHTVRKVQLYPLQAGEFTIDPMEVVTKVDFSRSVVYKKTEQEIKEGILPEEEDVIKKNTETFESSMNSGSIPITVKAPPAKNRPPDFSGATGKFSIAAEVNKNELGRNEEGELIITVSGKGNFTQLSAPVIQWPHGIEGFDPQIKDELDHNHSPLKGTRVFRFPFVSSKAGNYTFPSISFSFFDPDSNHYKTVLTTPAIIVVSQKEKSAEKVVETKEESVSPNSTLIGYGILVLLAAISGWIIWARKKSKENIAQQELKKEPAPVSVTEILQPAIVFSKADNKLFYTLLRSCIWNFFSIHFGLKGSNMSRHNLLAVMNVKRVNTKSQQVILEILQDCETGIFADLNMEIDRKAFLGKTKEALEEIAA
ncbi:MAG: BatD family protein [Chitinophagaceae bacterium]